MVLKAIKELATGFEGCEKKIEIDYLLTDKTKTLRNIPRESWDEILEEAKCTIIGMMSNDECDSYVLSESSLFVFPSKILIKTCGTTSLLNCIIKLMHHAKLVGALPDFLQFSRSNFLFPQLQPFPHRNFDMESQYLNTLFQGQAYILGPINGPRWHLYIADFNRIDAKEYKQQTMEMVMFNLDPAIMKQFYKRDESDTGAPDSSLGSRTGVEATTLSGIDKLIPGSTIDSHQFAPCGYSCNGLLKDTYFTIHITPEPECSFVSFETNLITSNYTSLVQQVLTTFRPGSFCMSLFVDEMANVSDARTGVEFDYAGYVNKNVTHHVFEGGYNAACGHFEAIKKSTNTSFGSTAYQPIDEHINHACSHTTSSEMEVSTPPATSHSFQLDVAGKLAVSYDTARQLSHEQMRVLALEAVRGRFELENYDGSSRSKQQNTDLELVPASQVTAHVRRLANQVIKQHAPESAFCLVDIGELVRRFYHWTYIWKQSTTKEHVIEPVYAVCGAGGDDGVFAALHALGCIFSCMSSSSLHSLLTTGIHHSRLYYTSPFKPSQQITYASQKHIHMMTCETKQEMNKIYQCNDKVTLILHIANPLIQKAEWGYGQECDESESALVGVGAGTGCLMEDVSELLKHAKSIGAHVVGVRFTFRNVITDMNLWRRALLNAQHVIQLATSLGHTMSILDIGGGLPTYSHEFIDHDNESKQQPHDSFEYICNHMGKLMDEILNENIRILCNAAPFFTTSTHTLIMNIVGKRALDSVPTPVTPVASRKRNYDDMISSDDKGYCYYVNDGLAGSYDKAIHIEAEPLELIAHVTQASIVAGATPTKDTFETNHSKKPRLASSLYGVTSDGVACLTSHTLLPELSVGDWLFVPNMGSSFNAPKQEFHGVDPPTVRYIHT